MGYGIRDGDIISLDNQKAGALTMSVPFWNYRDPSGTDPYELWCQQPSVRTVVDFVAQSISNVPFGLYEGRGGGKAQIHEGELAEGLRMPWPKQGQGRFIQALVLDLLIFGRWGFFALPRENGRFEFPKLVANRFSIKTDSFGRAERLVLWPKDTGGGEPQHLPLDDVVFDLGPEPIHGKNRYGTTAVSTLQDLAVELRAMSQYRGELFTNGARVPAVIERSASVKPMTDHAYNRFREEFSKFTAGGGRAGGTPLLEDGMTYKPVSSVTPKDAQYIESRKLALEEAAQAMHIPPELVGAKDGTNSNLIVLREQLYVDVLGPVIRWMAEAMTAGLDHILKPGQEIRADVESRLRADAATQAKIHQTQIARPVKTANEGRNELGLPSIEGGDELIIPLNVTEGGLASPNDTGQTNEPGLDAPLGRLSRPGPARAGKAREGETDEEDSPDVFAPTDGEDLKAAIRAAEADLLKTYAGITANMSARLGLDDVEPMTETEAARAGEAGKARGAKAEWDDTTRGPEALADAFRQQDVDLIYAVLETHLPNVAEAASLQQLGEMGADLGVWAAEKQYGWLSQAGQSYAQMLIDEHLYARMRETMRRGIANEPNVMKAHLIKSQQDARKWIAGTMTEVTSFGTQDAGTAAGAEWKEWVVTSSNPRESHAAINGLAVPARSTFPNGLRWPGDWAGRGPETANCKCRVRYY